MDLPANALKNKFINDIVTDGNDIKIPEWQKISTDIQHLINQGEFHIKLVSPKACLESILLTKESERSNLLKSMEELEKAFYCLMLYALNLCRPPIKDTYKIIKKYTGYYTCNIGSIMRQNADTILNSMGYIQNNVENNDEFVLRHPNILIQDITFDLYLSQLFCRKAKMFLQSILENGYSEQVAIQVFEHFDDPHFDCKQLLDYCQILEKRPDNRTNRSGNQYLPQKIKDNTESRYNSSSYTADVYSTSPNRYYFPRQSEHVSLANEGSYDDADMYENPTTNKTTNIPSQHDSQGGQYDPECYKNTTLPDIYKKNN